MRLRKKTGVIGCAIRAPVHGEDLSLEELLFDITQDALRNSGLTIDDTLLMVTAMCLVSAWLAWKLHKACD